MQRNIIYQFEFGKSGTFCNIHIAPQYLCAPHNKCMQSGDDSIDFHFKLARSKTTFHKYSIYFAICVFCNNSMWTWCILYSYNLNATFRYQNKFGFNRSAPRRHFDRGKRTMWHTICEIEQQSTYWQFSESRNVWKWQSIRNLCMDTWHN